MTVLMWMVSLFSNILLIKPPKKILYQFILGEKKKIIFMIKGALIVSQLKNAAKHY